MGEIGGMKLLTSTFLFFFLSANVAYGEHYTIHYPLEIDSLLVAWVIKRYVDNNATFSTVAQGEAIKGNSINTSNSVYRRSARFTAFDAAIRINDIDNDCVKKIQPIIKMLEITPWMKGESIEVTHFEKSLTQLFPEKPGSGEFEETFNAVDNFCAPIESAPVPNPLTDDLAFLALVEDQWQIVVYQNGTFKNIIPTFEPHTFDYNFLNDQIIYVAADKSVRLISAGNEKILLRADQDSYTQPSFVPGGKGVVLVELIDGSSTNTNIINFDLQTQKITHLLSHHSTQLDPSPVDDAQMYYSNVSCVEGCGTIIQEIWNKNLKSGKAAQLTLLNSIAHQPTVDRPRNWLYFSSNKDKHFHIWRLSLSTGKYEKLTGGNVTDSYPRLSQSGNLYFLRTIRNITSLFKREIDGVETPIVLPEKYHKIRELKTK
jgi:hypothetical protein